MFQWNKSEFIVLPIAFIIIVGIAIGLGFWLRNKDEKFKKAPLGFLAFFIVGLELLKQCFYYGNPNFTFYIYPLHFCSTFVFLFPLSQLFGKKCGKIFKPMAFCYAVAVILLMYANPHAIIGNSCQDIFGSFHNFHTFFFHHTLLAYVAFSLALGDYKPKFSHMINVGVGVVAYACYAAPCAFLLNSNYANILYSGVDFLENFRLSAGQIWYDVVLFIIGIGSMVLICLMCNLLYILFKKLKYKNSTKKEVENDNILLEKSKSD